MSRSNHDNRFSSFKTLESIRFNNYNKEVPIKLYLANKMKTKDFEL